MRDDFFEPERGGGGVMGWALRQLALWLIGGLVVYAVVTNYALVRPSEPGPAVKPQAQDAAPPETAPAVEKPTVLGRPVPVVSNSLTLRAQPDGYVYVTAAVNGLPMRMAFDTGASIVSLTQADAVRAGVAGSLNYTLGFGTANGRAVGAPVMLREIRIGQLVIEDVQAVVMPNLTVSLLGQSFLSRLESFQMRGGVLTLSWQ
jgi:aspartyl protease family protein